MAAAKKAKFVVIGLGGMGGFIAPRAMNDGHQFLGGVDVGDAVGQPLSAFVEHPGTPDTKVAASIDDVIAEAGKPDLAVIAANVELDEEASISADLLERGINVMTLEPTLFEGTGPIAEKLDAAAKKGGASIMATGIQDTWWVHLPGVAAATTSGITDVRYDDKADVSFFPPEGAAYEAGIGLGSAKSKEWKEWQKGQLARPAVQGGPMREFAIMVGFTPGPIKLEVSPVIQDVTVPWPGAESEIPAGEISGVQFDSKFDTKEGAKFHGRFQYVVLPGGPPEGMQSITITGTSSTVVIQAPGFDAFDVVCLGLVRRISDVVAAPPGLVRARELTPSKYVQPV